VALRITDDGRGLDPAAGTDGFGPGGMRARVAQVNGAVHLRAEPGAGPTIGVDLPRSPPAAELPRALSLASRPSGTGPSR